MICRDFNIHTKAFICNEIQDTATRKMYMKHARECKNCMDELEVIYSMLRALGDISGPDGVNDGTNYLDEINIMFEQYDIKDAKELHDKGIRTILLILIIILSLLLIGLSISRFVY